MLSKLWLRENFMTLFPNVIGASDCTHVCLKPPSMNDYAFVNRKIYHSIAVQVTWDAGVSLLNVVAPRPGGTHDSFIWQNSSIGTQLEEGDRQCTFGQTFYSSDGRFRFSFISFKMLFIAVSEWFISTIDRHILFCFTRTSAVTSGGGHTPARTACGWLALWDWLQTSFFSQSLNNITRAWLQMIWNII